MRARLRGWLAVEWMAPTTPVTAWPLPHSAANVKKWEIELQTLRESNTRLTSALQESAASVEQWKRQFSLCRDENDRLRNKVGSAEATTHREWEAGMGRGSWGLPSTPSPLPPPPSISHLLSYGECSHAQK